MSAVGTPMSVAGNFAFNLDEEGDSMSSTPLALVRQATEADRLGVITPLSLHRDVPVTPLRTPGGREKELVARYVMRMVGSTGCTRLHCVCA